MSWTSECRFAPLVGGPLDGQKARVYPTGGNRVLGAVESHA